MMDQTQIEKDFLVVIGLTIGMTILIAFAFFAGLCLFFHDVVVGFLIMVFAAGVFYITVWNVYKDWWFMPNPRNHHHLERPIIPTPRISSNQLDIRHWDGYSHGL
jgi:hypothetical protein